MTVTADRQPTLAEVHAWRHAVATRLQRAESADAGTDPIAHRLDEYRACIAELDEWIADIQRQVNGGES